jgi:hypothetical protein
LHLDPISERRVYGGKDIERRDAMGRYAVRATFLSSTGMLSASKD